MLAKGLRSSKNYTLTVCTLSIFKPKMAETPKPCSPDSLASTKGRGFFPMLKFRFCIRRGAALLVTRSPPAPPPFCFGPPSYGAARAALAPADRAVVVYIANKHSIDRPHESLGCVRCCRSCRLCPCLQGAVCLAEAVAGRKRKRGRKERKKSVVQVRLKRK